MNRAQYLEERAKEVNRYMNTLRFRQIFIERLEQIKKRENKILNTKTYKEKIISDIRDVDYRALVRELGVLAHERERLQELLTLLNKGYRLVVKNENQTNEIRL